MPRQGQLSEHLSVAELEQRYRQATDPVARSHFQILWLRAQGQTTPQVAQVTGYSPHWIRTLVRRYNAGGVEAMGDHRHHNPGGQWLLSEEQKQELDQALQHPPDDGGLWTGPQVAAWMEKKTGKPVHPQRGWEYLRLLEYTPQVPRPRHHKADAQAQADFKKNTA
jgi:transposase